MYLVLKEPTVNTEQRVLVIFSLITNGMRIRPLQQDKEFRNECLLRRRERRRRRRTRRRHYNMSGVICPAFEPWDDFPLTALNTFSASSGLF